jgi:hypothetical protein
MVRKLLPLSETISMLTSPVNAPPPWACAGGAAVMMITAIIDTSK